MRNCPCCNSTRIVKSEIIEEGEKFKILKCKRCRWRWFPRKEKVILCPKCKSAYWNIEKVKKEEKEK